VPVYFYRKSDNRIVKDEREVRRLLKTGEGRWVSIIRHRKRSYRRDCEGAKTFDQAKKIDDNHRQEILANTSEETMTLATFGRHHYQPMILQKRTSRKFYEHAVEKICDSILGPMKLQKITSNDIEDFLMAKRSEITKRGTQRSGGSCNRFRAVLSGMFRYARKRKYYAGENPVREVEPYDESGGRRERTINANEEAVVMAKLNDRDPILRYVAEIALKTGMRRGEVCLLRWEWLDFSRGRKGYIKLPATICKNKDGRSIPMLYNVRELLLELRGDEEKTEGDVFGLDPNSTGIRISRVCNQNGLKGVGLHVLRHTFATRCLDAGVHPFIVKQWMGHKSLAMTDYYSHAGLDETENAIAKLEARMGEKGANNGMERQADVPEMQAESQAAL